MATPPEAIPYDGGFIRSVVINCLYVWGKAVQKLRNTSPRTCIILSMGSTQVLGLILVVIWENDGDAGKKANVGISFMYLMLAIAEKILHRGNNVFAITWADQLSLGSATLQFIWRACELFTKTYCVFPSLMAICSCGGLLVDKPKSYFSRCRIHGEVILKVIQEVDGRVELGCAQCCESNFPVM